MQLTLVADRLHRDELSIGAGLLRALVDRQFPAFAAPPLHRLPASGSTNALFRLGDELLVRLPRQPDGTATITKEQRWLPYVARRLPVAVPRVVAVGEPDLGYPERWSIVRWLDGQVPSVVRPESKSQGARWRLAYDLAAVVNTLRDTVVPKAALNDPALRWYRGLPLAAQDESVRAAIKACRAITDLDLDLDAVLRVWEQIMAVPATAPPSGPRWLHGDLLAENLLVAGDRLVAVLDFGGLAVGDPT